MDTFLVHVWKPADGIAPSALRGVVRHVPTGQESPFRSDAEVVELLRRLPGSGTDRNHHQTEGNQP